MMPIKLERKKGLSKKEKVDVFQLKLWLENPLSCSIPMKDPTQDRYLL